MVAIGNMNVIDVITFGIQQKKRQKYVPIINVNLHTGIRKGLDR